MSFFFIDFSLSVKVYRFLFSVFQLLFLGLFTLKCYPSSSPLSRLALDLTRDFHRSKMPESGASPFLVCVCWRCENLPFLYVPHVVLFSQGFCHRKSVGVIVVSCSLRSQYCLNSWTHHTLFKALFYLLARFILEKRAVAFVNCLYICLSRFFLNVFAIIWSDSKSRLWDVAEYETSLQPHQHICI